MKKKHTQFIFDDLKRFPARDSYGYLTLQFKVISKLTEIRDIKVKITQKDLAQRAGMTQPVIARIEAGRVNPSLMQLVKIAHALGHRITFEPAEFGEDDYDSYLE